MVQINLSQKSTFKMLLVFILLSLSFINAQITSMSGQVMSGQINGIVLPLPGAHVNIQGTDAQAVSDSLGYYELSFFWNWNGPVTAQCHAEGYQSVTETFFPNSDLVEMDFLLFPQLNEDITHLTGFVRQTECEECPIPGATIEAFNINSPTDEVYSTESTENGHYLLELPLQPDYGFIWNVTVNHSEFQSQTVQLEIGPDGAIHNFFLAPNDPAPTIGVYGYVSAPSPNGMMLPVPGALITVWSADSSDVAFTTESGENGYYELEFGPGEYNLTCAKEGFLLFETSFWVGNVPVHLPIILQPAPIEDNLVFSGIVMGALGGMLPAYAPLPGAHVEVFYSDDSVNTSVDTYTNEEGYFSFFVDDSEQGFPVYQDALVQVSAPGYETQELYMQFYYWPITHEFYLEVIPGEDFFLSGHVYAEGSDDPTINLPIGGALVQIFGGFSGGLLDEVLTNEDGIYQFGDVATAAYAIEISAEGFISQEHSLPGYGGEYPMEMDFILVPGEDPLPYIAGYVYNIESPDSNIVIPEAFLQLYGFADDEIIEETHSNQSGYYQFISNGLFIEVSAFGYISQTVEVPQVDCAPGNNRCWPIGLDIYLVLDEVPPQTGVVFGVVTAQLSPMGPVFPVSGALITATPQWGNDIWESTETNDAGEYSLVLIANDFPWTVTCSSEYGIFTEIIVISPEGEVQLDFHFNSWEPTVPAPFDLIAVPGTDDAGNLVAVLNWQYPPLPDPNIIPEFHIFLMAMNSDEWIHVGTTLAMEFVFPVDDTMPSNTLCFTVNAQSMGMVSEFSNTACANFNEQDCFDLSGIDFGPCDMVLGVGWNGEECTWISGCSTESDGVDYSQYFFDTIEGCVDSCSPLPETGVVFGWVTVQFSEDGPTIPIAGAQVTASFPNSNDSLQTAITNEDGSYEMVLPALNWGYAITCTTEYGTQTHTIFLLPGGEMNVNFHWDTWQNPTVPAPFGLSANYDASIPPWGGIILHWQYPILPDLTQIPVFRVYGNFVDPNGGWSELGITENMEFVYHLNGLWNPPEVCFSVSAMIDGEESGFSNVACAETLPQDCFDLSDIDFGDCDMVLGVGWNGEECVSISGCSWEVNGVDYTPYFFDTFDECIEVCNYSPPPETAILYGTVNYLWGDAVELIAGAQIIAQNEIGLMYETASDDYGSYELQMIAGTYVITCSLPDSGESQSQTVTIQAGDMMVMDFWFGEPIEEYAIFGMVYGETTNGDAIPLDGAHIMVNHFGMIFDAYSIEGSYWIGLPEPGEYQVMVEAEGYIGEEVIVNITGMVEWNFFLQPLDIGMLVVHLNVGSATAMPGDTVAIPIFVETEHPVGGIQFTLTDVPDHATAIGYLSHMECFSASFNEVEGSAITIFFSSGGCTIDPGTLDFAHLLYVIDSSAPPGEAIILTPQDVIISNPDGEPMEYLTQPGIITLGVLGDVNMDTDINVLDIVHLVNFILLMDTPTDYEFFAGDINGDNALNVLDVVQLVNLILGPPGRGFDSRDSSARIDTGNGMIAIHGNGIAGFQLIAQESFHLNGWNLPNGWTVRTAGNRLIAYTIDELIHGSAELYTTGDITIESILLSDQNGNVISTSLGLLPNQIRLHPNYPNPFNPVTTISYDLPEGTIVTISVYDVTGQLVSELANGYQSIGAHSVEFNGEGLSSGTYIVMLTSDNSSHSRKILLLK